MCGREHLADVDEQERLRITARRMTSGMPGELRDLKESESLESEHSARSWTRCERKEVKKHKESSYPIMIAQIKTKETSLKREEQK